MTNFDDDDREADQIRLRRIGQEHHRIPAGNNNGGEEETKGDFERIFHDSGIEFAHFVDGKESTGNLLRKLNDSDSQSDCGATGIC